MSGDRRNDRTYRAICGRSPKTEPRPAPPAPDFHESLALLYGRVKSQNKLAAILDVPRWTLRRWLAGETPQRTAQDRQRRELVERSARRLIRDDDTTRARAARRARLDPKREAKLRAKTTVIVKARLRYEDEGGPRIIKFSVGAGDLDAGAIGAAVDAYLNGATAEDGPWKQNEGIFAPIQDAMSDEWYREAFQDPGPDGFGLDVEGVTFT